MAFEKFSRSGNRTECGPMVRIQRRTVLLNAEFVRRFLLPIGEKHFIELYFDGADSRIGLLPSIHRTKDSYSVKVYRPKSPTGVISCADFIKSLPPEAIGVEGTPKTYPAKQGADGMIVVSLKGE